MRNENIEKINFNSEQYIDEVKKLSDEVKMLALNLAVNLARSKNEAKELTILEPEFTKLVNGSVEVVKEVGMIMKAFKNEETMAYSATDSDKNLERIERSLNEILRLSTTVLESINEIKKNKKHIEQYNGWKKYNPKEGG